MAENDDVLRHPLFPGDAELCQSPFAAKLSTSHVWREIKAPITATCDRAEDSTGNLAAANPSPDYFTLLDDRWNPQLSIWRGRTS